MFVRSRLSHEELETCINQLCAIVDLCDSVEVKRKVILQLPHIARSFHRSVRVRTLCVYEYTSRVRVSTFAAALVEYLLVCCALDGLYELVLVLRVRDLDE